MQKSTSEVVPPNAAETVPEVKSSQVVVPPKNISMCVCGSIAPGMTYFRAASITLSAVMSSDQARRNRGHRRGGEQVVTSKERLELAEVPAPGTQPRRIRSGREEKPGEEARADVRAVVGEARSQPRKVGRRRLREHDQLLDHA